MSRMPESDRRQVRKLTAQLAASDALLRSLIQRSPDAFVIVDATGTVQFVNPAAVALFGVEDARLIGRPFGLPVTAGETSDVDIVSRRGEAMVAEMRVVETEWNGRTAHVAVLRDITERSRAEKAVREQEMRLTLAMDVARLDFLDLDLPSGRLIGDEKLLARLGYDRGDVGPRPEDWKRLVHSDDLPGGQRAVADHLQGATPVFRTEVRVQAKSGEWRWMLLQGETVEWDHDGAPRRVIAVTEDISERKQVAERIRVVSQHDPLTGLPNRALLYEFADHLLATARRDGTRAAFLFVDLDRFKPINDTYGHDVGDAVLKEVAIRLGECVRRGDLVARLGGDEFLAVLSQIHSEEDAARAARHALDRIGQPYHFRNLELTVTPSIGISLFPQNGTSIDELIKNADTAMYHAKDGRQNDFQFFQPEFNEPVHEALRIESRLRQALARGEFVLHYQPVVDTDTAAVVGAEALLRWPAMDSSPDRFIAVAEKAGVMQALGEWVLREACRQQREWQDKGLPAFSVAVNVSPVQFRQKHFADGVGDTLQQAGLGSGSLRIEVTESTVMRNFEEAKDVLCALHALGVKIALDDFGTGYSSLSYLSRLPIDILKLDQSFIKGIGDGGANTAVAEGIIALGRSLGLEVIAEGVESAAALDFLRAQHCPRSQGFHFSRPMTAAQFEQWCVRSAA